jgi:hypothetical protein
VPFSKSAKLAFYSSEGLTNSTYSSCALSKMLLTL